MRSVALYCLLVIVELVRLCCAWRYAGICPVFVHRSSSSLPRQPFNRILSLQFASTDTSSGRSSIIVESSSLSVGGTLENGSTFSACIPNVAVAIAIAFCFSTPALAIPFISSEILPEVSNIIPPAANLFDPATFQPICPASDSFYQMAKGFANALVGADNVAEYGPLIASVLLRVRLELCVFESFIYEAVVPFIQQKGFSWILPLHETLETFIAGTVFAVASNFILLGSTKIFTVLLIYLDAFFGLPLRLFSRLMHRFAAKNTTPAVITQTLKIIGEVLGTVRGSMEAVDTFVGRYLVFLTTVYILFKFVHFKLFNDVFS